ncbi:MAG: TRAP transporter small permease [Bradyrhizobiaceae bacterium]|nr:TRAP transporter small permease [Bradyrhizobiaceae bacterium]
MSRDQSTRSVLQGGKIGRIGDAVSRICLTIAAVALLGIVVINGANVIGRYVFGSPFSWAEELMLFLMVLVVFAGAPAVAWRNMHIRIDAIIDRASPIVRRAIVAIASLISVVILLIVAFAGSYIVTMLYAFDQRSDALHLPVWIPQSFLTGGLALTAILIVAAEITSRSR